MSRLSELSEAISFAEVTCGSVTSIQIRLLSEVRSTKDVFELLIGLPDGSSNPAITKLTSLSLLKPLTLVTASHFIPVVSPDCELTVIIDWPLIVNEDGVSTRSLVSKRSVIVSSANAS